MPEYIESMFDDCEYACDPSAVLRRASRTEAGWLAHLARERATQEREALELGFERELQVWRLRSCLTFLVQRLRSGPRSWRVRHAKCATSVSC